MIPAFAMKRQLVKRNDKVKLDQLSLLGKRSRFAEQSKSYSKRKIFSFEDMLRNKVAESLLQAVPNGDYHQFVQVISAQIKLEVYVLKKDLSETMFHLTSAGAPGVMNLLQNKACNQIVLTQKQFEEVLESDAFRNVCHMASIKHSDETLYRVRFESPYLRLYLAYKPKEGIVRMTFTGTESKPFENIGQFTVSCDEIDSLQEAIDSVPGFYKQIGKDLFDEVAHEVEDERREREYWESEEGQEHLKEKKIREIVARQFRLHYPAGNILFLAGQSWQCGQLTIAQTAESLLSNSTA